MGLLPNNWTMRRSIEGDGTHHVAIQGVAAMQRGRIIDLTVKRALAAAALSSRHSLPMADSIILAAAREHAATVWTLDDDFSGFPDVRYIAKK